MPNRKFDKRVQLGTRKVGFTNAEWDTLYEIIWNDKKSRNEEVKEPVDELTPAWGSSDKEDSYTATL